MMMKLLLFTLLGLLHCSAGDPLLVCQETVKARIGDNVTLTCQLKPKQNIEDETIDCKISNFSQPVYAYRNRRQLPDQEDQYRHRTSLDVEDLKIGVLNLSINSVTQSDEGTYRFYIRKWDIYSTVTLSVEPADLMNTERPYSTSAETSVTGVPPPSGDPPSGDPPSDDPPSDDPPSRGRLGVTVSVALVVALGVVVLILVKRKETQMMMMRVLMHQHDDEDQRRAAGNGRLDPAERETMLKLEL